MFWSGNYIAVRELNSLLKEENVTLTQVLEADDVLQECKADNKALIQFLTRPDILAELITLITEEPPKNVELSQQYRHASIACEVLTSYLPTLSDRLSMDTVQMNRLCDFINREPPLNPLLASYFSKTIEMLLERSPKQDWYLYHIVCLRVLDFLKARRDFLPNLLRHLHTSAAADALRCFVRLNDLFNKIVMEWLEEHQFLECLIQIVCCSYEPEPLPPPPRDARDLPAHEEEKGQRELSEKADAEGVEKGLLDAQGKEVPVKESPPDEAGAASGSSAASAASVGSGAEQPSRRERGAERVRAVAAANAAALLCDIVSSGCAGEPAPARPRTAQALVAQATSPRGVRALLQGMFTAPPRMRRHALVHGARVLLRLRAADPAAQGAEGAPRGGVELAVAPHLPLLHTALLQPPEPYYHEPSAWEAPADGGGGGGAGAGGEAPPPGPPCAPGAPGAAVSAAVGAARLHVAELLAALCASEVDEVATTMLTLGTPGVVLDMFFRHADNNFLHAHAVALVHHALNNQAYRTQYARHILEECDLLNRLIDVYEENEIKRGTATSPRSGYMGHVLQLLRVLAPQADEGDAASRFAALSPRLHAALQRHDTPLGGYYPSDNSYEVEDMAEVQSAMYNLNYNDATSFENEGETDRSKFLELADERIIENLWPGCGAEVAGGAEEGGAEEGGARAGVRDVLADVSPWEAIADQPSSGGEGWAHFSSEALFGAPADPFAACDAFAEDRAFARRDDHFEDGGDEFTPFWGYQDKKNVTENGASSAEAGLLALRLDALESPLDALSSSLADNLRTAMSSMAPEVVADIVSNMPPVPGARAAADGPSVTDAPSAADVPTAPSVPSASDDPIVPGAPVSDELKVKCASEELNASSAPSASVVPTAPSVPSASDDPIVPGAPVSDELKVKCASEELNASSAPSASVVPTAPSVPSASDDPIVPGAPVSDELKVKCASEELNASSAPSASVVPTAPSVPSASDDPIVPGAPVSDELKVKCASEELNASSAPSASDVPTAPSVLSASDEPRASVSSVAPARPPPSEPAAES